jgi:hypothetical protein
MKKIILTLVILVASQMSGQVKVYQEYQFEGESGLTINSLKNEKSSTVLTTNKDGKVVLKEIASTEELQKQIDELKKQVEQLTQLVSEIKKGELISEINDISISPNPTSGLINIKFGRITPEELVISDLSGKVIYKTNVNSNNISLNMTQYTKGLYLINFLSNGKSIGNNKIYVK